MRFLRAGDQKKLKMTYSNMLLWHISDALQHTTPNSITQILRRRLRVNVTQINSSVHSLGGRKSTCHIHRGERCRSVCEGRETGR